MVTGHPDQWVVLQPIWPEDGGPALPAPAARPALPPGPAAPAEPAATGSTQASA
jgi:hypothetical protein